MADGDHRALGTTGLAISPIGLGSWAFSGQWGPTRDEVAVETIHRAIDLGCNWIDTAPSYGHGRAEEVVARAIRGLARPPLVFTKCGVHFDAAGNFGSRLDMQSIRTEVVASLARLGVDAIDLYQLHWGQPDAMIEEAWSTLVLLRIEGLVRHIGASNLTADQVERCNAIAPVETIQPPYSMLSRTDLWTAPYVGNVPRLHIDDALLPLCDRNDIGVLAFSPLASGLLSSRLDSERITALPATDWRTQEPDFRPENVARIVPLVRGLARLADRVGATVEQFALAWVIHVPGVTGAIAGMRSPAQAEALLGAAGITLSPEILAEADGLLAAHGAPEAPTTTPEHP